MTTGKFALGSNRSLGYIYVLLCFFSKLVSTGYPKSFSDKRYGIYYFS